VSDSPCNIFRSFKTNPTRYVFFLYTHPFNPRDFFLIMWVTFSEHRKIKIVTNHHKGTFTLLPTQSPSTYSIPAPPPYNFYGLAVKTGSIALQKFLRLCFLFFIFVLRKKVCYLGSNYFFPDLSIKKRDTLAFFF